MCALPFRLADDVHFRDALQKTAKLGEGFLSKEDGSVLLPHRTQLSSKHIPELAAKLRADAWSKFRRTIKHFGCTLASDSWTDVNGRIIQNCIASTADGELFLKAVDVTEETKNGNFIAEFMCQCIEEVGPEFVTAVCMDGAPNNRTSFKHIQAKYPRIMCFVCPTHSIDLFIKNACSGAEVTVGTRGPSFPPGPPRFVNAINRVKTATMFVFAFSKVRAMLKKQSKRMLVKPCDTRFGSKLTMCFRFLELHKELRALLSSEEYKAWEANAEKSVRDRAEEVWAIVFDDALLETLEVSRHFFFFFFFHEICPFPFLLDQGPPTNIGAGASFAPLDGHDGGRDHREALRLLPSD